MRKYSAALVSIGLTLAATGITGSVRQTPPTGAAAGRADGLLVIRDVRLFDGTRTVPRTTVVVRDGLIVGIGPELAAPAGAEIVDGSGKTLLPGLIDAHTHAFGDALERALLFGVTTELDMFTDHRLAAQLRGEQRSPAGAPHRADILSAGTLVTAPKGHGTEYGMAIPTITTADEAASFVDARLAEGSDYIKIVYDDGRSYGLQLATIGGDVLRGVIAAAKNRGKLAVVHAGSRRAAEEAIAAGASGLVHLFANEAPAADFVPNMKKSGAFVISTLSVIESTAGTASGATLASDARMAPFLTAAERASLNRSFPSRPGSTQNLTHALQAARLLHEGSIPLLAGSDAPNPGTAHGVTMHRELELLVKAGLPPASALSAATSVPARVFKLADRGRIAQGLRADLLLVSGDPTVDITATRDIARIWKGGKRVERRLAPPETSAPTAGSATGAVSTFDGAAVSAEFGHGWEVSTDSLMGGKSTAAMAILPGGANGTRGALEVRGVITPGGPYPWAGAMFYPGSAPMAPANLSRFKEIVFWTQGDGGEYRVMMFATGLGNIPAIRPFTAGREWKEVVMPLSSFNGIDGSDLRGVLFSAAQEGPFRFAIDEVRLR